MMWFPSIWYPSLAHRRIKASFFLLCTLAMLCGCAEFASFDLQSLVMIFCTLSNSNSVIAGNFQNSVCLIAEQGCAI